MSVEKLDKYKIERELSARLCFTLYEALDETTGLKVFLKLLNKNFSINENIVYNFLNTARIHRILDHPQICKIFHFGNDLGNYFIISEPVAGQPLSSFTKEDLAFSYQEFFDFTNKLANTLNYIHQKGLIHGVLTPQSIYLTPDNNVKIDDTGFLWYIPVILRSENEQDKYFVNYLAPECITDFKIVDSRVDIYSLGVILFQLITDTLPVSDHSSNRALLSQSLDISENFQELIIKCLEKSPDQRFQNFTEFIDFLNSVQEELFGTAPSLSKKEEHPVFDLSESPLLEEEEFTFKAESTDKKSEDKKTSIVKIVVPISVLGLVLIAMLTLFHRFFKNKTSETIPPSTVQETIKATVPAVGEAVSTLTPEEKTQQPTPLDSSEALREPTTGKVTVPPPLEGKLAKPELIPLKISVKGKGKPLIASVYINGKYQGRTDNLGQIVVKDLEVKKVYTIRVSKIGYFPQTQRLTLSQENATLKFNLKPIQKEKKPQEWARLVLEPLPRADSVQVDDKYLTGKGPFSIQVKPGKHRVRFVNLAENHAWQKEVEVQANQVLRVTHDFRQVEYGRVAVALKNASQYGFAFVFVNGKLWNEKHNTTPLNLKLPVGQYTFSVKREGFTAIPSDTTIQVKKNAVQYLSFKLVRTP